MVSSSLALSLSVSLSLRIPFRRSPSVDGRLRCVTNAAAHPFPYGTRTIAYNRHVRGARTHKYYVYCVFNDGQHV